MTDYGWQLHHSHCYASNDNVRGHCSRTTPHKHAKTQPRCHNTPYRMLGLPRHERAPTLAHAWPPPAPARAPPERPSVRSTPRMPPSRTIRRARAPRSPAPRPHNPPSRPGPGPAPAPGPDTPRPLPPLRTSCAASKAWWGASGMATGSVRAPGTNSRAAGFSIPLRAPRARHAGGAPPRAAAGRVMHGGGGRAERRAAGADRPGAGSAGGWGAAGGRWRTRSARYLYFFFVFLSTQAHGRTSGLPMLVFIP